MTADSLRRRHERRPATIARVTDHTERLAELAARLDRLREQEQDCRDELVAEAAAAHRDGMTVYRIAQVTGYSQPAVRKWLGL